MLRHRTRPFLLLLLVAPAFSACEGCLDLDEYTLVPSDGALGSGGSAGTAPTACEPGVFDGNVFVSFVSNGSAGTAASPCAAPASSGPGIELFAIDPAQGNCRARTRIVASSDAGFTSMTRVRHSASADAVLAGALSSGTLEFPETCSNGSSVVLRPEPGANETLFVARLRLEGAGFCSVWLRRAWTTELGGIDPIGIHALEMASAGEVAIGGTLGGKRTLFENGTATAEVLGGAFVASWSSDGSPRTRSVLLASGAGERLTALSPSGSSWLATGTLRAEQPACHACNGVSHVADPAGVCPASAGGAGGADGSVGAGGVAGVDASASEAGVDDAGEPEASAAPADASEDRRAASSDARNAVLLLNEGGRCDRLESFGSDRFADDVQVVFDVSRTTQNCGAYLTGLAGQSAWRLLGSDATTSMAPSRDAIADGFIARLQGGQGVGCPSSGPSFSLRLESTGVVAGDQIAARRCSDAATASVFVPAAAGEALQLKLCRSTGGCSAAAETVTLGPDADAQVVVMEISATGELGWHTSFGPVRAGPDAARGSFVGRPEFDLALDARDNAYVVLQTDGALRTHNGFLSRCDELEAANPASGTWLIQLGRSGVGDKAECRWAKHLAP